MPLKFILLGYLLQLSAAATNQAIVLQNAGFYHENSTAIILSKSIELPLNLHVGLAQAACAEEAAKARHTRFLLSRNKVLPKAGEPNVWSRSSVCTTFGKENNITIASVRHEDYVYGECENSHLTEGPICTNVQSFVLLNGKRPITTMLSAEQRQHFPNAKTLVDCTALVANFNFAHYNSRTYNPPLISYAWRSTATEKTCEGYYIRPQRFRVPFVSVGFLANVEDAKAYFEDVDCYSGAISESLKAKCLQILYERDTSEEWRVGRNRSLAINGYYD